ncbi:MAG: DUF1735 domain-containing protein [Mediterranea sp.]|nr:DUF1735 domain-containing protein [Mediterranea sp.]
MKKNTFIAGLLLATGLMAFSCDDAKDDNLTPDKVYIVNSGEVPVTLYDTGVDEVYNLGIYRSGAAANAAGVSVVVLTPAELEQYNADNGTAYDLLPDTYYKVLNNDVAFEAGISDSQLIRIDMSPTPMKVFLNEHPEGNYVIPIQLVSASVDINPTKAVSLLKPTVIVPRISLGATGLKTYSYAVGETPAPIDMELPVSLSVKNLGWDITCQVETGQQIVSAYNAANDTYYSMAPADAYTLTPGCELSGNIQSANLRLQVDGTKLRPGNYLIPVRLTSVSRFEIDPNANLYAVAISVEAPTLDRTTLTVIRWSNHHGNGTTIPTSPTTGSDSQGVSALFDGNLYWYWHANWSSNPTNGSLNEYPMHFIIDLKDEYFITQIDLWNRRSGSDSSYSSALAKGDIYITSDDVPALIPGNMGAALKADIDKVNWTKIGTFATANVLPVQKFGTLKTKGRYLRLTIVSKPDGNTTNLVVALAELAVHGYK